MRDIGKNIKDLRIRKDLTQDALAENLFVTRQTVSNYETGKSRPDIDMLMRIADVLEVDIHVILYGLQPKDRRPLIRLAAGVGITLILGLLWLISREGREAEYYHLVFGPMTFLHAFSQPLFFAMLGWTLAQGIAALTHAKQPAFPTGKWICCALAGLVLLWILMLLGQAASFLSLPRFVYISCLWVLHYSLRYPWLFLFPGIGIWLCGFPAQRK